MLTAPSNRPGEQMLIKLHATHKREKGQSLLELAFSMILLLLILAGIVDLGRAVYTLMVMQDAAEEGITFGVAFPGECDEIEDRVQNNLLNYGTAPYTVRVLTREPASYPGGTPGATSPCVPGAPAHICDEMVVEVTRNFQITMPFLGAFTGQTIPLTASANGILIRGNDIPGVNECGGY